jgi:cytoskeletal protein CcmA (bactofilin family)
MAKVIQKGDTFFAPKGSYFDGNVKIDGNFIVPAHTHFWGRLNVTGRLELGPRSSVALGITCGSAIIGSHARVKGPIISAGDVTILDHAVVHSVQAEGKVFLRTGVRVGDVTAKDTLIIHGRIKSGKLIGKNVKVLGDS